MAGSTEGAAGIAIFLRLKPGVAIEPDNHSHAL
jgi:hypothetical protein